MPPVYFGNSKVNFSGIEKAYLGSNLVWKKRDVIYTPILPDDTATYPMYLKDYGTKVYDSSAGGADSIIASTHDGYTTIRNVSGIFDTPWSALVMPWFCTHFTCSCSNNVTDVADGMVLAYAMTLLRLFTTVNNSTVGIFESDSNNTKITKFKAWLDAEKTNGTPVTVLYPASDGGLWFAVTDGTSCGYYNPSTKKFVSVYGMTGVVIQRVEYVEGNNDAYCKTSYHLRGDDTLKIKFQVESNASNIGGCFVSSSALDNFCLYAGVGAKWYMRYDGGNGRNYIPTSDWQQLEASPTGAKVNGNQVETWAQASFTSSSPMYIGYLYKSTSPKIRGKIAHFEVVGKHTYLPVKIGDVYRIMDVLSWELCEQVDAWSGGPVISEPIPFPSAIYTDI